MKPNKTHLILFDEVYQQMMNATGKSHILFGKKGFVEYQEQDKCIHINLLFYANNVQQDSLDKAIIQAREMPEADIQIPIIDSPSFTKILLTASKFTRLPIIGAKEYPIHQNQVGAIHFYSVLRGEKIKSITADENYNKHTRLQIDAFFSSKTFFQEIGKAEQKRAEYLSLVERIKQH